MGNQISTELRLPAMILVLALGLLPPTAMNAAEPVRVMSFNIRGDFDRGKVMDNPDAWLNKSDQHRRDRVIDVIKAFGPDLLGVQEALANQVDALTEALPDYESYSAGRDDGLRAGESCAIYYRADRFEKNNAGTFWLSEQPKEPGSFYPGAACTRIASWVVLRDKATSKTLFVLNTHWDHVSVPAKQYSAKLIQRQLPELAKEHAIIVMGDMNSTEETTAIRTLLGNEAAGTQLVDSYRELFPTRAADEATFHGFKSGRRGSRIDFILHGPELVTTKAAIVHQVKGELPASDHYPVTATLDWRE